MQKIRNMGTEKSADELHVKSVGNACYLLG
jgi:hypothetical protein